ncbi:MAG: hypothetical protein EBS39_13680 [Gammaproteobacteria bacterium]|nr:hypothetical protein [Gammaproteobacteria bacterium]
MARVPAILIGGYLGAGKTTLVNHLLRHADGRRIAVLVNDFGEVSVDADLIRYAAELGYRIRLVALARRAEGRLSLRVAPALVRAGTPLAETRGAYNAVSIVGDAVGRMFFHGLGAGQMPTASAVVATGVSSVNSPRAIFSCTMRKVISFATLAGGPE